MPGPGVITGASDDDPGGIATYSITGARTGYTLLWTTVFTLPLNAAVQNMCARIGLVTGEGLAFALKRRYHRGVLLTLVALLFVANTANIGADLAAVASGVNLLTGVPTSILVIPIGVAIAFGEIVVPYRIFATYLKLLTLVLFAYVIDAFVAGPDWRAALRGTFLPHISLSAEFMTTLVALLGTTISPYLFFWQTSEEVEELHEHHELHATEPEVRRAQLDVDAGMVLPIWWPTSSSLPRPRPYIRPASATSAPPARPPRRSVHSLERRHRSVCHRLHRHRLAFHPRARRVRRLCDRRGVRVARRTGGEAAQAPQFYIVIAAATLVGLVIAASGLGAIQALFIAAVLNGVIAPVLIAVILRVSNDEALLGVHRNGPLSNLFGYGALGR